MDQRNARKLEGSRTTVGRLSTQPRNGANLDRLSTGQHRNV